MISKSAGLELGNSHPRRNDSSRRYDPRLCGVKRGRGDLSVGSPVEDPRYKVQHNVGCNASDNTISDAILGGGRLEMTGRVRRDAGRIGSHQPSQIS